MQPHSRWQYFRELRSHWIFQLVFYCWTILAAVEVILPFFPSKWSDRFYSLSYIPHFSWPVWVMGFAVIALGAVFEAAYKRTGAIQTKHEKIIAETPVTADPNPYLSLLRERQRLEAELQPLLEIEECGIKVTPALKIGKDESDYRREQIARLKRDIEHISQSLAAYKGNQPTSGPTDIKVDLEMTAADPRVYLEIEKSQEAMFQRTPFILHNAGGDVAHSITVSTFRLARKAVTVPSVETIPASRTENVLPTIDGADIMTQHDIFHWLAQDWNGNGTVTDDWPISLTIKYSDFSKKKTFATTMELLFHPVRYTVDKNHPGWPSHDANIYEIVNVSIRRLS